MGSCCRRLSRQNVVYLVNICHFTDIVIGQMLRVVNLWPSHHIDATAIISEPTLLRILFHLLIYQRWLIICLIALGAFSLLNLLLLYHAFILLLGILITHIAYITQVSVVDSELVSHSWILKLLIPILLRSITICGNGGQDLLLIDDLKIIGYIMSTELPVRSSWSLIGFLSWILVCYTTIFHLFYF